MESHPLLTNKTPVALALYHAVLKAFQAAGPVTVHPAKTMIGLGNGQRRIAYITQVGKNFVHVVFPFKRAYPDNLCFHKMGPVPGNAHQFNHHFRLYAIEDLNEEVQGFIRLAYANEAEVE
ncbi:hypothetical protein SAMN05444008_105262 [Cnuella takakiae]|uniref:DUF5655 domain-containing protein n=1 Tax=Cnuella takakiae TaxID=1302690 RepID=A0A1M4ZKU7_9BACT|nr:DUF5655 domain-containing protein [Cnuella takakiae]OLY94175.1 hypothetical protein BUE76_21515 [Cnuella takakiae]SHF18663.1 hypothetical protein SAMN05444008_105262 [Cnuella takakiae]